MSCRYEEYNQSVSGWLPKHFQSGDKTLYISSSLTVSHMQLTNACVTAAKGLDFTQPSPSKSCSDLRNNLTFWELIQSY